MKTAMMLLTAIVMPGGFIVLGLALVAYVTARHRNTPEFDAAAAGR